MHDARKRHAAAEDGPPSPVAARREDTVGLTLGPLIQGLSHEVNDLEALAARQSAAADLPAGGASVAGDASAAGDAIDALARAFPPTLEACGDARARPEEVALLVDTALNLFRLAMETLVRPAAASVSMGEASMPGSREGGQALCSFVADLLCILMTGPHGANAAVLATSMLGRDDPCSGRLLTRLVCHRSLRILPLVDGSDGSALMVWRCVIKAAAKGGAAMGHVERLGLIGCILAALAQALAPHLPAARDAWDEEAKGRVGEVHGAWANLVKAAAKFGKHALRGAGGLVEGRFVGSALVVLSSLCRGGDRWELLPVLTEISFGAPPVHEEDLLAAFAADHGPLLGGILFAPPPPADGPRARGAGFSSLGAQLRRVLGRRRAVQDLFAHDRAPEGPFAEGGGAAMGRLVEACISATSLAVAERTEQLCDAIALLAQQTFALAFDGRSSKTFVLFKGLLRRLVVENGLSVGHLPAVLARARLQAPALLFVIVSLLPAQLLQPLTQLPSLLVAREKEAARHAITFDAIVSLVRRLSKGLDGRPRNEGASRDAGAEDERVDAEGIDAGKIDAKENDAERTGSKENDSKENDGDGDAASRLLLLYWPLAALVNVVVEDGQPTSSGVVLEVCDEVMGAVQAQLARQRGGSAASEQLVVPLERLAAVCQSGRLAALKWSHAGHLQRVLGEEGAVLPSLAVWQAIASLPFVDNFQAAMHEEQLARAMERASAAWLRPAAAADADSRTMDGSLVALRALLHGEVFLRFANETAVFERMAPLQGLMVEFLQRKGGATGEDALAAAERVVTSLGEAIAPAVMAAASFIVDFTASLAARPAASLAAEPTASFTARPAVGFTARPADGFTVAADGHDALVEAAVGRLGDLLRAAGRGTPRHEQLVGRLRSLFADHDLPWCT